MIQSARMPLRMNSMRIIPTAIQKRINPMSRFIKDFGGPWISYYNICDRIEKNLNKRFSFFQ